MFAKGVTCSDCHDPHGQKLRAEGNAVCTQCHEPATYEARTHHFHVPSSKAGECVSCHMPLVTYMVVDPRHDHSFRVPRPDLAATLGTPDVCTDLPHRQAGRLGRSRDRHGSGRARSFQTFGEAFHAADRGAPRPRRSLPTSRATRRSRRSCGRVRLRARARPRPTGRPSCRFRRSGCSGARGRRRSGRRAIRHRLVAPLARLLRDPTRQVRMEAVRSLAGPAEMRFADADRAAFAPRSTTTSPCSATMPIVAKPT